MNNRKIKRLKAEDDDDRRLEDIISSALEKYKNNLFNHIQKTESYLFQLPADHQALLATHRSHLQDLKICIDSNYQIIEEMTKDVSCMFENDIAPAGTNSVSPMFGAADHKEIQATLKLIFRDWSKKGAEERLACYQPIINEIVANFPADGFLKPSKVQVLVPGSGLGRLAFEIACHGYKCEASESSLFMLVASNFIFNRYRGTDVHKVYPWINQFVNNVSPCAQIEEILFPDINPAQLPNFVMRAGEFLKLYTDCDKWVDCVATCFFVDSINNIVAVLKRIFEVLKPGGFWINLEPVLHNFSDVLDEDSLGLSYVEFCDIVNKIGFIIEKMELMPSLCAQNPRYLRKISYEQMLSVFKKPIEAITIDVNTFESLGSDNFSNSEEKSNCMSLNSKASPIDCTVDPEIENLASTP